MNDKGQFLTFKLKNTLFSFPLEAVTEIIEIPDITSIPLSYDYIMGITNLRGSIIPVVDLSMRIYGEPSQVKESSRIIIAKLRDSSAGFFVDEVYEVKEVLLSSISSPDKIEGVDKEFLTGIFESNGKLISILSLENLIETGGKLFSQEGKRDTVGKSESGDSTKSYDEHYKKILSFLIGDNRYAIEIEFVREIVRMPKLTPVPSSSEDVEGVFELRDEVVPAINIAKKLGVEFEVEVKESEEDERKVIIYDREGIVAGLIVEKIDEVVAPLKRDIVSPPETLDEESKKLIKSIYRKSDKELIFILNEKTIVEESELEGIEKTTEKTKKMHSAEEEEENIVIFKVGEQEFGFKILDVHEINRISEITPVPRASSFIEGIINLRGDIVPVINMRTRLSLEKKDCDEFSRVIIVNIDGYKTGLIVDRVEEIKSVPLSSFQEVPEFLTQMVEKELIKSIVSLDDGKRIVTLLKIGKLLSKEEKKEIFESVKVQNIPEKEIKFEEKSVSEVEENEQKENYVKEELIENKVSEEEKNKKDEKEDDNLKKKKKAEKNKKSSTKKNKKSDSSKKNKKTTTRKRKKLKKAE